MSFLLVQTDRSDRFSVSVVETVMNFVLIICQWGQWILNGKNPSGQFGRLGTDYQIFGWSMHRHFERTRWSESILIPSKSSYLYGMAIENNQSSFCLLVVCSYLLPFSFPPEVTITCSNERRYLGNTSFWRMIFRLPGTSGSYWGRFASKY